MSRILVFILLFIPFSLFSQTRSALFIGNSYTYANSTIPVWVNKIAISLGDSLSYEMQAPGGAQLNQHAVNPSTLSSISSEEWDYVVLQEQSLMPSFPPEQVAQEVYPYAEILCDSIYSNNECSIPMFFMTWGRENGDQSNCEEYPPICTYEGMQNRLRESYIEMAEMNNGQVAPVGIVWKTLREMSEDTLDLYSTDGSHPSMLGTYVAACTFYASMFHKSPVGADYPASVDADDALMVQQFTNQIVFDSLNTWMIDTTKIYANFTQDFLVKTPWVYLFNNTEAFDSCYWDFDDGSSLWQYTGEDFVQHEYYNQEYYNVCLTVYLGCKQNTYCMEVIGEYSGISDENIQLNIYPNPSKDKIIISSKGAELMNYNLINSQGLIMNTSIDLGYNKAIIDVRHLQEGIYFLQIEINNLWLVRKIIIK